MNARLSRFLAVAITAVFFAAAARGDDGGVFTADLPFDAAQPLPAWMHGPPVSAPGQGARIAFHLSPPRGQDLLVHFVFDETEGGGLRIEWLRDGQSTPELLAENLGESLGVPNQRPLLISASRLGGNGSLLLQGGANLNVNRVKFEWVSERTMLSSNARYVPVVVTASRLTLAEADVEGGPRPALRDEWRDRVVRAALTEGAELLTPSLELLAELEQAPEQARLEASLAGVFLDQEIWLLVNGQEVGPIAVEVPTLEDPGHLGLPGREVTFAGWRRASVHIPADSCCPGKIRCSLSCVRRSTPITATALLSAMRSWSCLIRRPSVNRIFPCPCRTCLPGNHGTRKKSHCRRWSPPMRRPKLCPISGAGAKAHSNPA